MGQTTNDKPGESGPSWMTRHLWQIQPVRDLLMIAAVLLVVYLGYVTRMVTVPLLLAMILAYMFEPLVRRATRGGRMSRQGAAAIIILLATVIGLVPAALALTFGTIQAVQGVQTLTRNVEWLIHSVDRADPAKKPSSDAPSAGDAAPEPQAENDKPETDTRGTTAADPASTEDAGATGRPKAQLESPPVMENSPGTGWVKIRDWVVARQAEHRAQRGDQQEEPGVFAQSTAWVIKWLKDNRAQIGRTALQSGAGWAQTLLNAVTSLGYLAFSIFLVAFFFYFFCSGYGRVLAFWEGLIPERRKWRVVELLGQMDRVIAGFIRGRLTICACLMVFFTVAYGATGVPGFLVLGPLVGLLTLLPYVGGLGAPVAMLLMWLGTDGTGGWQEAWWWIIGAPLAISGLSQVLDDYILSPLIQGKNTDMDMPSILFASIAGGILAGVYGLILAIPAAACLKILIREVFWPRLKQWIDGQASDFIPLENPLEKARPKE
jgi:predicted PurR-regulated permease PerM